MSTQDQSTFNGPESRVGDWWRTDIIDFEPGKIWIRGFPIEQLIGNVSFPEMIWLMLKGELPGAGEADLLAAARRSDDESDELLTDAFLQELLEGILFGDPAGTAAAIEESAIAAIITAIITYLSLAAVFFVAVFIGIRSLWAYWFRGLEQAGARWAKLQQLASLAGAPMRSNRTPLESARQLEALVGEEVDLGELAAAYSRERYAATGAEYEVDEEAADQLRENYVAARNRLIGRVVARAIRFGRVRSPRGEVAAG